jgi:hypothetical protein
MAGRGEEPGELLEGQNRETQNREDTEKERNR